MLSDSFFLKIKKARDGIRSRPNNKKAIKFKERRSAFFVCSTVVVNHLALANPKTLSVFYTTLAQSLHLASSTLANLTDSPRANEVALKKMRFKGFRNGIRFETIF